MGASPSWRWLSCALQQAISSRRQHTERTRHIANAMQQAPVRNKSQREAACGMEHQAAHSRGQRHTQQKQLHAGLGYESRGRGRGRVFRPQAAHVERGTSGLRLGLGGGKDSDRGAPHKGGPSTTALFSEDTSDGPQGAPGTGAPSTDTKARSMQWVARSMQWVAGSMQWVAGSMQWVAGRRQHTAYGGQGANPKHSPPLDPT